MGWKLNRFAFTKKKETNAGGRATKDNFTLFSVEKVNFAKIRDQR